MSRRAEICQNNVISVISKNKKKSEFLEGIRL